MLRIWQLPHVMMSHHFRDAPSAARFRLQGNGAGGLVLGHCSAARPVCSGDACSSGKHNRQSMAHSRDMACRTRRGNHMPASVHVHNQGNAAGALVVVAEIQQM